MPEAPLRCGIASFTATWHQLNESNLAFLLRLAEPHDVAVRLEDGKLRARDEAPDTSPAPLSPQRNIERLRLIADLNHQARRTEVHGYNLATDQTADGSAEGLQPPAAGRDASEHLRQRGWEGLSVRPHPFARTQAEAEALAQRRFRHQATRFLHGEMTCQGQPDLRAGREIDLSGVSPRFAGRYRVIQCNHRFDNVTGFTTRIKVQRPDWNP